MQKWEYKILTHGFDNSRADLIWFDSGKSAKGKDALLNRLNDEGESGWELAGIEKLDNTEGARSLTEYILKRPKE